VEIWRDGTGQVIPDLAFSGGEVTIDGTSSGVRSTLSLTAAKDAGTVLWDLLAPTGTEVMPYRGIRFIDGTVELVPLGVFGIDSQRMGHGVDGTIDLTAPDRWARVQRARFLQPATTNGNAINEAIRLATAAVPVAFSKTATSAASTKAQIWDRDRDAAIVELMQSAAAEMFFDRTGKLVARNVPKLTNLPVWTVDAGESGVLVSADRERNRSRTCNIVVALPENVDGAAPFAPQIAYDTDPGSPTFVGGSFGQVPMFYSSPLLTTAAQALAAAKAILGRVTGLAAQVSLESSVNPALDAGDVISVVLPGGTVETHLIDSVTIPLDAGTPQKTTTRSTRPEGDVPE
jgi:hypothetical protein